MKLCHTAFKSPTGHPAKTTWGAKRQIRLLFGSGTGSRRGRFTQGMPRAEVLVSAFHKLFLLENLN